LETYRTHTHVRRGRGVFEQGRIQGDNWGMFTPKKDVVISTTKIIKIIYIFKQFPLDLKSSPCDSAPAF